MKLSYLLICLYLLSSLSSEAKLTKSKTNLADFKIISAEQLDYKEGNSSLIGDVKIKLGEFIISSPKVLITNDKNGDANNARFIEKVKLKSKDLNINAPEMEIDVEKSLFKCFGNKEQLVETFVGNNGDVIYSGYQEFEIETGFSRSATYNLNDPVAEALTDKVRFKGEDLNVESNGMELEINNGQIQYVDFITKAIAKDSRQRTEADEIFYFPSQSLFKADGNVQVLYLKDKDSMYVFADQVLYERGKKIFSAFSESFDPKAEVHGENTYGKARQIILLMDKDDQIDRAIFTGNAFAQFKDKAITGHEILMNLKNKTLQTLVGRPKTQIFKK